MKNGQGIKILHKYWLIFLFSFLLNVHHNSLLRLNNEILLSNCSFGVLLLENSFPKVVFIIPNVFVDVHHYLKTNILCSYVTNLSIHKHTSSTHGLQTQYIIENEEHTRAKVSENTKNKHTHRW